MRIIIPLPTIGAEKHWLIIPSEGVKQATKSNLADLFTKTIKAAMRMFLMEKFIY